MAKELVVALSLGGTLTHTGQAKRSSSVGRPLDGPALPTVCCVKLKSAFNLEDAGSDLRVFLLQIGQD